MVIKHDVKKQLIIQLNSFFGKIDEREFKVIKNVHDSALKKIEFNFKHIANKYYENNRDVFFNPLHVTQYTVYLYTISSIIYKRYPQMVDLCDKIYGLLKMISSADLYYEIDLPEIWFCDHPQSAVIGRAVYSNYFSFSQGCTVGNNKGQYPCFGEHVTMFSNSKIIGKCNVGDHVIFAANSYVIDSDIPSYSIVFGTYPNQVIHKISDSKFEELTNSIFR